MIKKIFNKAFDKKVDGIGLGVFRIVYSAVLLWELINLFSHRHLLFDQIPFLVKGDFNMGVLIFMWILSVIGILIGFQIRLNTVISYVFTVFVMGTAKSYEYHMFYAYLGMNFLFLFLPLDSLSLDLYSKGKKTREVRQIYYFIPIFMALGLIYFDSIFHKFDSRVWLAGLGVWGPSSHPVLSVFENQWLLNQKWLMLFLGYLTLIFETLLIFLFPLKRFRWPLFFIGVGLHVGILFSFPIPIFATGYTLFYILFIPISFWQKILNKLPETLNFVRYQLLFRYVPSVNFEKKSLSRLLIIAFLFQCVAIYNAPVLNRIKQNIFGANKTIQKVDHLAKGFTHLTKLGMGIGHHGVFTDQHFDNFNYAITIAYIDQNGSEQFLPIINKDFTFGMYFKGILWAKFGFRVNGADVNQNKLEQNIPRFLYDYLGRNDLGFKNKEFIVYGTYVEDVIGFEKDFLSRQRSRKWTSIGTAKVNDLVSQVQIDPNFKQILENAQ